MHPARLLHPPRPPHPPFTGGTCPALCHRHAPRPLSSCLVPLPGSCLQSPPYSSGPSPSQVPAPAQIPAPSRLLYPPILMSPPQAPTLSQTPAPSQGLAPSLAPVPPRPLSNCSPHPQTPDPSMWKRGYDKKKWAEKNLVKKYVCPLFIYV